MFLGPVGDDPQAVEVKRLEIRPGDLLVFKFDHFPGDEELDMLHVGIHRAFEGAAFVPKVLVLEPGAEIGVIGPQEAPQPPGMVRQAALEALLSTGFDSSNARAVLGMGPEADVT